RRHQNFSWHLLLSSQADRRLRQHIDIKLFGLRLGAVLGEFDCIGDDRLDLAVDLFQLLLAIDLVLQHILAEMIDRIMLGALLVDLFLGAVFRGIGHGMAAVAIGFHLENIGALAAPYPVDGLAPRFGNSENVHAIHLLARHIEALAAAVKLSLRRGALDRSSHGIFVILDHINDRQAPEFGHIKSLIDLPLVDRAVAHIAERDGIAALIFLAEGKAGAKRNAGADNAMPAEEVGLAREHMHGAALALGIATLAARKFGHHAFRIHAADEHMT